MTMYRTYIMKIHDITIDGAIVWQEVQALATNSVGLFSAQLGSTASLEGVNWAQGLKFLQVEFDLGSGYVDLGTQQMMSVPYSLYADEVTTRVSSSGDTLFM